MVEVMTTNVVFEFEAQNSKILQLQPFIVMHL